MRQFRIRHYQAGLHSDVATLFTRSVHELTCNEYSGEERSAWAPLLPDLEYWRLRCELKRPFLVVDRANTIAAFLELDPDGHIDCAYVHPAFARQGTMTLLMDHAEAVCRGVGIRRLYAEVSHSARPFFLARGWQSLGSNVVERRDVLLTNTNMDKQLGP